MSAATFEPPISAEIAVDRVLTLAYTLSGAIAGVAGIVMLASVGVSSAFAGQTHTFDALAAVLLGGTTFQGGRGGILGAHWPEC